MIETTAVTKAIVQNEKRSGFLPKHFPIACMMVENTIYGQLAVLSKDYKGGSWEFYELDNGGCFMAPNGLDPLHLANPENYSDETMSCEAAGVVACLDAFSHLSFNPALEYLADKYHQLREFALDHPEGSKIFALID